MKMTYETFETAMTRLYAAFGRIPNQAQMGEYWDSFQDTDEAVFQAAFRDIKNESERFPSIAQMKNIIARQQRNLLGAGKGHFDAEKHKAANCTCDMGLIFTVQQVDMGGGEYGKARYVYRCPRCKSYDAPSIPFYFGDGLNDGERIAA